uniref:Uncharacterized protein n=1 Tax=Lepeophtheirus salmonis TaxID=72036 RepID=A0A0K2V526_LEPSM
MQEILGFHTRLSREL